ncbi:uncharacterized protein LOC136091325 isoform X3 [Hydra vulgaris]|uniref:Uncharacterized protein LOC136091325 isoform X3 n=1 Tax=Hydra vulgaris TaxID=6087 RepID=A0ABM4DJW3_HYDVU
MMLSSNILVENGSKNCVLDKEDSKERHLSCQDAITRQHHDAKICECYSGILKFLRQSGTRLNRKVLKMNNAANAK